MRMMCIKGKQWPEFYTGITAGMVYEVNPAFWCPCGGQRADVEGSVFHRPTTVRCLICKKVRRHVRYVPWAMDRFIPWDDPPVSVDEANELYAPTRLIEELL